MDVRQILPPHPQSAARARLLVSSSLRTAGLSEHVDTAVLLTSELVTNALLHAGSEIELRLSADDGCVRAVVQDHSPVLPAASDYDEDAATGRGLGLVEMLATRWGVERRASGKAVWFELGDTAVAAPPAVADARPIEPAGEAELSKVQLRGVPVLLWRAQQQHNDALLRELALLELGASGGQGWRPLAHPRVILTDVAPQLDDALRRGRSSADAEVHVPQIAQPECAELLAVLDIAEQHAAAGALLTPPALPEIRALRHWWLGQVISQLDGLAPVAWGVNQTSGEELEGPLRVEAPEQLVDRLADAVVLADDQNRIAHLNPAAERLLGWSAAELAGRRLTRIIPERLHEAHLAGFTRHLVTGQARILGTPTRVPARRKDGSEVLVDLLLSSFRGRDGRQAYVGSMRRVVESQTTESAPVVPPAARVLEEVTAALVVARAAGDSAEQLLLAGAERLRQVLGWDLALVWTPGRDGLELECRGDAPAGAFEGFVSASRHHRFARGTGLPGRVWASRQATLLSDVVADANYPRADIALQAGLRTALAVGVPDAGGDDVLGVIEVYRGRVLDDAAGLPSLANAVAAVIGLACAR